MTTDQNMDQIPHEFEDAPPCPKCGSAYVLCLWWLPPIRDWPAASAGLQCAEGHRVDVGWADGEFDHVSA